MNDYETDVLIIGAGPVGLFSVFELGQLGIKSCIIDSMPDIGGQCTALYPEKPIYDIPAYPKISAENLIKQLCKQIEPFQPKIILNTKVQKLKKLNNRFLIESSNGEKIFAKCIIIAAGCGAFGPNKPPIPDINEFEEKSVFYSVTDKSKFEDKTIAIAGGGDSAVDWAIELSSYAKKIYFIHRRAKLRAAPNNVEILKDLSKKGKIEMVIPFQLESLNGKQGYIESILLRDFENRPKQIKADYLIPFYGLSSDLGPIKDWELDIFGNSLKINQSSCQTSQSGIFAIGDICNYKGKLKLILTGFSEAATAAYSCYNLIFPDKVLHFEYSTSKGINKI